MLTRPSQIKNIKPWSSVLRKSEYETVALNIIVILARTGDKFRELSWQEYKTGRLPDGNFSNGERSFFERVQPFTASAENAKCFSQKWNI